MKAHHISDSGVLRIRYQVVESALSARCIDPFLQSTGWKVTVVVDRRRPPWHDINTSIAVTFYGSVKRPESIYCVQQQWASVIANYIHDSIIFPSSHCIAIVQTCDG